MNRYEKYNNSELSWLETIPEHWDLKRIARVFDIRKEKNSPIKTKEILSLSAKYGVSLYSDKKEKGGNKPKEDLTSYNLCYPGDILINCMNIVAGSVGISNYFGAISPVYYPLVNMNQDENCTRYMEYVFRNYDFQRSLVGLGKGIQMSEADDGRLYTVRMRISWDMLKTRILPIPPIKEQEQIVNYLDWKINEIDRLIQVEKEKIKELNCQKQLSISYEYKKTCENRRLKMLISEPLLYGINGIGEKEGDIRFIRITDIDKDGELKKENCLYFDNCDEKFLLKKGDILLARSGATVGKSYIHKLENGKMSFAGYLIRARLNTEMVIPEFVYLYTQSIDYEKWKESIFIQSTIQNISAEKYANLQIPYVDKMEQKNIIQHVGEIINSIEKYKKIIFKKIKELELLKQSLISEVVTGKIDVRNIVIPEYEKVTVLDDETDELNEMEEIEDGN